MKTMNHKNNVHNYGVDMLRMVSMFLVAILHTLGQGGIIGVTGFGTPAYGVVWFLETAAFCAVNCYALISGFVSGGRSTDFQLSRLVQLWLEVAFYTVSMTVIFAIALPESVGWEEWLSAFFPILSKQYWYFNAYFVLAVFMPFINRLILSFDQKEFKRLLLAIFIVFSVMPTVVERDIFVTGSGYSGLWLICLFIAGSYVRIYGEGWLLKSWQSMGLYLACVVVAWLWKIIDFGQLRGQFIHYTSPFIVLASVFLLLFFRDLRVGRGLGRWIAWMSPGAFGVYLIHVHPLFWKHVMAKAFVSYAGLSPWLLGLCVLLTAFGIYFGGTVIDLIRIQLFKSIKYLWKRMKKHA